MSVCVCVSMCVCVETVEGWRKSDTEKDGLHTKSSFAFWKPETKFSNFKIGISKKIKKIA